MSKQDVGWPTSSHDRIWEWRARFFADRYTELMEPMEDVLGLWSRAAIRTINAAQAALKAKAMEDGDATSSS